MDEDKKTEIVEDSPQQASDKQIEKAFKESAPPEIMEALKGAPPEVKRQILSMGAFHSVGPIGSPFQSLFNKFTPAHIDKFLDYTHKDEENNVDLIKTGRKYPLIYTCIAVVLFAFLVVYLSQSNIQLLNDIIKYLAAFAGGFGGGYGVKSHFEKKK